MWTYRENIAPPARGRSYPSVLPHDGDDNAANGHVLRLGQDRGHRVVRRLQAYHPALLVMEALDRRLAADQSHHRLSVFRLRPLLDDDVIAIEDSVADHRVALDAQRVGLASPDELLGYDQGVVGLDRFDRLPCRHLSEERQRDDL